MITTVTAFILSLLAVREFCGCDAVGNTRRNCEELPKEGFEFLLGKYKMFN